MSVFDLDVRGQQQLDEQARQNPATIDSLDAGFFAHPLKGIGMGVMRGGAEAADMLQTLGRLYDEPSMTEDHRQALDEFAAGVHHSTVDYWTPNAGEVGTAGRVLGGLSEMALPLAAAGGNPALLIGTTVNKTGKNLVDQGVDARTAAAAGSVEGLATAAGFKIPFLGKTLASRLTSGAIGNLAVNAGATTAEHRLLLGAGYDELAKQYDPLDLQSRAIDVLSGLAFGGLAHVSMLPSDVAAVATAANAKHFQHDTAPGRPADISASVAHQDAMEQAIQQLMTGEPVTVPASITTAQFVRRERAPAPELPQDLKDLDAARATEAPLKLDIPYAGELTPEQQRIEADFRRQIGTDPDAAMKAYTGLEDAAGGKILNTDTARELSADYLKNRGESAAVHEPASALVKFMYEKKLAEPPAPGEIPMVLFSAGGTGAGKTSALSRLIPNAVKEAQVVYDTNLNNAGSAIRKIDQALAAKKNVTIAYVYREPIDALKGGALPRAMRQEKKFGTGRTVPLDKHIDTHVGSREAIDAIAAHYAGDERVQIRAIDNSQGKNNVKFVPLRSIPKVAKEAHNQLREEALQTLESEHQAGRISDAVRLGFAPEQGPSGSAQRGAQGVGGQGSARDGGRAEQTHGRAAVDPIVAAAHQAALTLKTPIPTGEFAPDGTPVVVSATELLARGEAEIADAHTTAKGIIAAVNCFLANGAG